MDGLDRLERHDNVSRILDVDHQLRATMRCDMTHGAEHLATVSCKHLISYCDCVLHDAILRNARKVCQGTRPISAVSSCSRVSLRVCPSSLPDCSQRRST